MSDYRPLRDILELLLSTLGIAVVATDSVEDAFRIASQSHDPLAPVHLVVYDCDTVELHRSAPMPHGLRMLKWLRSHHCSESSLGCVLDIVPVVAIGSEKENGATFDTMRSSDPRVVVLPKALKIGRVRSVITEAMADLRDRLRERLRTNGLAIMWTDGRYEVRSLLTVRVSDPATRTGRLYSDLLLLQDQIGPAESTLGLFEDLLNAPGVTERHFQSFFRRHPEFLFGDEFDDYWSEPFLPREALGTLRPDFVLGARLRQAPWRWAVVDLKRPNVPLMTNAGRVDLSSHVYRVATQLRDYGAYFQDPRNRDLIRARFGIGPVAPQLVAIIGRTPVMDPERFSLLTSRLGSIRMVTYDEVLALRRARVQWFKAMQGGRRQQPV